MTLIRRHTLAPAGAVLFSPLALAGVIMVSMPAFAAAPQQAPQYSAASAEGVDLGPSSRITPTRLATMGAGHQASRYAPGKEADSAVRPVRDDAGGTRATGTVNTVDPGQRKINLSHNPIPSIGWPAMTMDFAVAPTVDLTRVKPGSRVDFTLQKGKGGMYEVQSVQQAGAAK
jgi:Cu(I)/Ag(I) efflux system protein CusF